MPPQSALYSLFPAPPVSTQRNSLASSAPSKTAPYSNVSVHTMPPSTTPHPSLPRRSVSIGSTNSASSGGSTSFLSWISSSKGRPSSTPTSPRDRGSPPRAPAANAPMQTKSKVGRSLKSLITSSHGHSQGRKRSASMSGFAYLSPSRPPSIAGAVISRPIPIPDSFSPLLQSPRDVSRSIDPVVLSARNSHSHISFSSSPGAGQSAEEDHVADSNPLPEPMGMPHHPFRAILSTRPSMRPASPQTSRPPRPNLSIDTNPVATSRSSSARQAGPGLYGAPSPTYKVPAKVLRPNPNAIYRPSIVSPLLQPASRPPSTHQPAQPYPSHHRQQYSQGSEFDMTPSRTSLYESSGPHGFRQDGAVITRMVRSGSQVSSTYRMDRRHEALSQLEGKATKVPHTKRPDPPASSLMKQSRSLPTRPDLSRDSQTSAPFLELDDDDDDDRETSSKGRSAKSPATGRSVPGYPTSGHNAAARGYTRTQQARDVAADSPMGRESNVPASNSSSKPRSSESKARTKPTGLPTPGGLRPDVILVRPSSRSSSSPSEALDSTQLDSFPLPPTSTNKATQRTLPGYQTTLPRHRLNSLPEPQSPYMLRHPYQLTQQQCAASSSMNRYSEYQFMETTLPSPHLKHHYHPSLSSSTPISASRRRSSSMTRSSSYQPSGTIPAGYSNVYHQQPSSPPSKPPPLPPQQIHRRPRPSSRDFLSMCETDDED